MAILDRQLVQAAPVAAGAYQGEPHPGPPLQRRHAVHRARGLDVAGQRHTAEDVADGAQALLLRLVQEGWDLFDVPGHQQEALAALRQPSQLAAVVGGFGVGEAVVAKQLADLVEQVPATGCQAWDILEGDQRHRVIRPGLAHQPDAAQGQFVEGLVAGSFRLFLGQQAARALAGAGNEHAIRSFAAGGATDVLRGCLPPTGGRLLSMEADVLVAGEQVQLGAWYASQFGEIAQDARIDVDATETFPVRFDIADARARAVEALGAAAQAAAEVEVVEGALKHGCYPRTGRRRCRTSRRRIRSGRTRAW
ncbi:Uncharacterised protein [Pseudomonas aeruginosa]|nr:Uncharacterised protein [Pseudomonas aeruginosa]